ncbi:Glycogen synthase, ADP-glucose transglucosylase (EC [Olavius algarvensis Delta 1 endosymbiont]|nr:Glycogen synthase, ADP-glucose transglucosylase (EC [Olavius algarvensis Delta 1 endosymbiont]
MPEATPNPRVLVVTPEVTYLPHRMGGLASFYTAKAGGLADVSASLISALFEQGADVHVAIPDYRALFSDKLAPVLKKEFNRIQRKMPDDRIHLAEDRAFYYINRVYSLYGIENIKLSLAFQREVINNIVPRVQPDLIHCNDWMTGLIPAMARRQGIPCLFTVHNVHTVKTSLAAIEDRGIDGAYFWQNLYFDDMATNYEHIRDNNPVDLLTSGIFAAHFVNVVSPTFLQEIIDGRHPFIETQIRRELINKVQANCAAGILNAPDPSFDPTTDEDLVQQYGPTDHTAGKKKNKRRLQEILSLIQDDRAPLFFWPSRLDPVQKGCQLLAEIFYRVISRYWDQNLQVVFVANGDYQMAFRDIVNYHQFQDRVAICDFSNELEHLAYGAADFILMPSSFEPCGLPQMIAPIYGALPVAHDTGGIHDTIAHLDTANNTGNGFLFNTFDATGLFWAIEQAMLFFNLPGATKSAQIERVMEKSALTYTHANTARRYIELYEEMLQRPLIAEKKPDIPRDTD